MQPNDRAAVIYTTFPDLATAKVTGGALVEAGLVACANILPAMTSVYRWEGAIETSEEVVMILKTRAGCVEAVIAEVESRHPYDTPAIVSWTIETGSAGYLDWIRTETAGQ